jgi:hypothetical protein
MLRRCDADEMFMELVQASRKYTLPAFSLAAALVATVGGRADISGEDADAMNAVQQEWGSLLSAMWGDRH